MVSPAAALDVFESPSPDTGAALLVTKPRRPMLCADVSTLSEARPAPMPPAPQERARGSGAAFVPPVPHPPYPTRTPCGPPLPPTPPRLVWWMVKRAAAHPFRNGAGALPQGVGLVTAAAEASTHPIHCEFDPSVVSTLPRKRPPKDSIRVFLRGRDGATLLAGGLGGEVVPAQTEWNIMKVTREVASPLGQRLCASTGYLRGLTLIQGVARGRAEFWCSCLCLKAHTGASLHDGMLGYRIVWYLVRHAASMAEQAKPKSPAHYPCYV